MRSPLSARSSLLALIVAALVVPRVLSAQQRDDPAPDTRVSETATVQVHADDAAARPAENADAPRSLMGMVMAMLIESAEQQAARERSRRAPRVDATRALGGAPAGPATATTEQVAVQSPP